VVDFDKFYIRNFVSPITFLKKRFGKMPIKSPKDPKDIKLNCPFV
jgi:hypothetical protein